ncbi:MAG: GNAT family N-acetyltransferase [Pseudomonadota bacterium]
MAATHRAAFSQARLWSETAFRDLLASPHCFAIGTPAAFALVRVIAGEAELLTLATHPDQRRQGLALAVMSAWEPQAHRRGATRAFLEVAADNLPARALYDRCGYTRDGYRKGYYNRAGQPPADALIMSKDLAAPA